MSTATAPISFSQKAFDLMIRHESLNHPGKWPGGDSGVTIGYGYDLGYKTRGEFLRDWSGLLPKSVYDRLLPVIGLKGAKAAEACRGLKDIVINPQESLQVFRQVMIPDAVAKARKAFPGYDLLARDAQGALASLVSNRGGSVNEDDPRRAEMDTIVDILADGVQRGDYAAMACQLRSMKRLWVGMKLDGLITRREDEALLIEGCIQ